MEQQLEHEDESFQQANMMGDIKEDIEFLGFTITGVCWVIGITLIVGGVPFMSSWPVLLKLSWAVFIFLLSASAVLRKWLFRSIRQYYYLRTPKQSEGALLGEWLGTESDGWFYRSEQVIQVILNVTALPWSTATLSAKKQRLGGFENFLRACNRENIEATFSAEMINDFRHELWNAKQLDTTVSPGVAKLRQRRLDKFRNLASSGEAQRSEYTLCLSIAQYEIKIRERDDEPMEATKEELERFRMVAELREKLDRTMSSLVGTGHTWSIISGFATPELLSRWWSRTSWKKWKSSEGDWIDEKETVISAEEAVDTLLTTLDEQPSLEQANHTQEEGEYVVRESWIDESVSELNSDTKSVEQSTVINKEDEPISSESVPEIKEGKVTDKLSWMRKYIEATLQQLNKNFQSISDWFSKPKRKKKSQHTEQLQSIVTALNDNDMQEDEKVLDQVIHLHTLKGIYYITSPVPTGKSFTATNMAVANSKSEQVIHLIDLSRDRGCYNLLNPLSTNSDVNGWDCWKSPHAPHLFLWTPTVYPETSILQNQLLAWSKQGVVFVDLPYYFPERHQLLSIGQTVGVVDTDYHHWLQWEKEELNLDMVWMNQTDQRMKESFLSLIQKKFGQNPIMCLPYFADAAWWCFQGIPLAIQPKTKEFFHLEGSVTVEEVME